MAYSSTNPILQVRGGSGYFNGPHPSTIARAATTAMPQSASGGVVDKSSNGDKLETTIDQAAQASLSIVGSSVRLSCFQDAIPYMDTRDCQVFRVVFVLGGPGAGALVKILYFAGWLV